MPLVTFFAVFAAGLAFGSLVEYVAHRLMHRGVLLARAHRKHHRSGQAKGVLWEFLHYAAGTAVLMPWGFAFGAAAGWGWLTAGCAYALFSAFGHQLQHDDPGACFWMRRAPVHHLHHRLGQAERNFGLALDWWDRVFGTFDPSGWDGAPPVFSARRLLGVRWL